MNTERLASLELDVDLRLANVWCAVDAVSEWSIDMIGMFIRAAYSQGYCDALTEKDWAALYSDHGYQIPGQ